VSAPRFLASIIGWLRAGYPEGVPEHDYVPLFALLARKLTTDEVAVVAAELAAEGGSPAAIREAIETMTKSEPLESDIGRVSAKLAAGGWPLAEPERNGAPG